MKELGKELERLSGQKTGETITDAYNAYLIKDYSDHEQDSTVILGVKRIGRELVRTSVHKGEIHIHHYLYFYDWVDPRKPEIRRGIEVERNRVRFYEVAVEASRQDAVYITNPTDERINYSIHFLKQMPTGPGDIRLGVKL